MRARRPFKRATVRMALAGAVLVVLGICAGAGGAVRPEADDPKPAPLGAAAPNAAATVPSPPAAGANEPDSRGGPAARVTNLWVDTEIRQVMQDISAQTGVSVLCDQSVQGIVSLSTKDMHIEECLERVCAAGGYSYLKVKDYYIVGRPEPGSPLFQRMAMQRRVKLAYANCDQVRAMLHSTLAPYVTYDKPNGAILITAPEATTQRILAAIELIDRPGQQIAIEAVVFELSEEGSKQLGLDWHYQKSDIKVGGTNLLNTITYNKASNLATYLDVTLRAILRNRKGQVLANPRIVVMNGQEADIFVGQEKYFSLLSGQASNPYYRLESIKAGVTLKVAPQIGDNGNIILQFEPEVSDVVTESSHDAQGGSDETATSPMPVVTRRRVKTVVAVKDGQTVVIGGLLREQHRSTVDAVPLLGNIPGIGAAFRSVQKRKEQQEVVILITANLVEANPSTAAESAVRLEMQYVSPLDGIAGTVRGQRPWRSGKPK